MFGVLEYDYVLNDGQTRIEYYSAKVLTADKKAYCLDTVNLDSFINWLAGLKLDLLFVYNAEELFPVVDTYIARHNLPEWESVKDNDGLKHRVVCDCYSLHDGDGATYSRKLWLNVKDTRPEGSRHVTRHALELVNFSLMVGRQPFPNVVKSFLGTVCDNEYCRLFLEVVFKFNHLFTEITHTPYITAKGGVSCLTLGAAAQRLYLNLRYPHAQISPLKLYQLKHKRNRALEYKFRCEGLLLGGAMYCPQKDKIYYDGPFFKFDINSLFPATERDLPDLGNCEEITFEEFEKVKNCPEFEFIFEFDYLYLKLKPNRIAIFSNPFEVYRGGSDSEIIIDQPYCVFGNFLKSLRNYYDIADFEIKAIYKLRKYEDTAIKKFVDILYPLKLQARKDKDTAKLSIVKLLIVSLHGKFAQDTTRHKIKLIKDGFSYRKEKAELYDTWSETRFDFIRGAYIYSSSRARYMDKILELFGDGMNAIRYGDTDSVVSSIAISYDNEKLGEFKYEEQYNTFATIAPKIYFGEKSVGNYDLVCAGAQGKYIMEQIKKRFISLKLPLTPLYPVFIKSYLKDNFYIRLLKRVEGGAAKVEELKPILQADYNYNEI